METAGFTRRGECCRRLASKETKVSEGNALHTVQYVPFYGGMPTASDHRENKSLDHKSQKEVKKDLALVETELS